MSDLGLKFLSEGDYWYTDGIFKVYREAFYQDYAVIFSKVVHAFLDYYLIQPKQITPERFTLKIIGNQNPDDTLVDF